MSEQASHSPETQPQDTNSEALSAAFEAFGIQTPEKQMDASETPADAPNSEESTPPAKAETQTEQKPGLRVKFNKEEVEIPEDQVPEYVQKGLALDKERERRSEYEKALDRAAKLQGFNDHADLIANLDRIEQEREQKQKDDFEQLKQQVVEELVLNGVDEQQARAYAENNPLVQQARVAMQEKERIRQEQETVQREQQNLSRWNELYQAYPDLTKEIGEDGSAPWYTSDMHKLVEQGYAPLHAYQLANLDKLQTMTKKQVEQKLVKEQRLGLRAQVETDAPGETEPEAPEELTSAFSLFGIDPRRAKKYAK